MEATTVPEVEIKSTTTVVVKKKILSANYPGNKFNGGSFQTIINQLPPHDEFISGFLGTCAVLANKLPAKTSIGLDPALEEVLPFWNGLKHSHKLIRQSFFEYIEQFTFSKVDTRKRLLYLDPPYMLGERKAVGRKYYTYELTDEQHFKLLDKCLLLTQTSNVMIAISHYPCQAYNELLNHGWRKIEWQVRNHNGFATEALYMNYPEPEELHDYSFLGKDKTDRQRIKRKLRQFAVKLNALPARERNAIIQAVSKLSTTTPPFLTNENDTL